jgi:hypothetical protein
MCEGRAGAKVYKSPDKLVMMSAHPARCPRLFHSMRFLIRTLTLGALVLSTYASTVPVFTGCCYGGTSPNACAAPPPVSAFAPRLKSRQPFYCCCHADSMADCQTKCVREHLRPLTSQSDVRSYSYSTLRMRMKGRFDGSRLYLTR